MKSKLLKEDNYSISDWSGGKTRQLAIFPPQSIYADRDFIWRLSSATVDLDESDFTMLPDYNRVLMVLKGNVVLSYDDVKTVSLNELEQDSFDGASKTKSFGRITDFNLMVRKGNEGILDVIRPESVATACADTLGSSKGRITHALYCKEGYFLVNPGTGSVMVRPGEMYIMESEGEPPAYTIMGNGVVIRAQIGYDYDGPVEEPAEVSHEAMPQEPAAPEKVEVAEQTEQPAEKVKADIPLEEPVQTSFAEEFKWCMFLANTQFRGAKRIIKKVKESWYDEELTEKISMIEKFYLTFIVFLFGILIVMTIFANKGYSEAVVIGAAAVWFVLDCVIVSPLIYYLILPKPIRTHVKSVKDLTPEEEAIRIKRENTNERIEKLMKKYEKSGRTNVIRHRERDEEIEE